MCSQNVCDQLAFKPRSEEWSDSDRWGGESQALEVEGMTTAKVWAGTGWVAGLTGE